jgi:hypothetical protein
MAHSNAWIGLRFLWYPSVFPGKWGYSNKLYKL